MAAKDPNYKLLFAAVSKMVHTSNWTGAVVSGAPTFRCQQMGRLETRPQNHS